MKDELKATYDQAVQFHGHPGVFIAIGVRMGLLALKYLNSKGYFDLQALIQTKKKPPYQCLLDGIQISTGSTIGKGNLNIQYSDDEIFGIFETESGKRIKIVVLPEFLEQIKKQIKDMDRFKMHDVAEQVLKMDEQEMFRVSIPKSQS
ncbi:MAG: FmdE family protein [Promethearchaeota archaeon]